MQSVEVEPFAVSIPMDGPVASATRMGEERDPAVGHAEGSIAV